MNLLTPRDLIDAGYEPGLMFKELLAKVAEYESRGIADPKYALKLLKRDVGPPAPKGVMRENPAPLAEAIVPETKEEKENVAAVKRQMQQLLKTPVIARGVILPDACPSGLQAAVIPVGGAIAVENAIIPSAHSADICCSMFATFYDERSSVAKELDALMTSTRFGPEHRHLDDLVHDPVNDENVWQNRFLSGLRDRARTPNVALGDRILERARDADEVDTVVLVEALVLDGDECLADILGECANRHAQASFLANHANECAIATEHLRDLRGRDDLPRFAGRSRGLGLRGVIWGGSI